MANMPIQTWRLIKPAICTGRRFWEVISAVAPYSSYLLQVTVGFILFSIALPAARTEANHTKVLLWMLRAICMARRFRGGLGVWEGGAGELSNWQKGGRLWFMASPGGMMGPGLVARRRFGDK